MNNIEKTPKPNSTNIAKAKTTLFTNYEISKTNCTFIPDNIPKFESRMDSAAHKLFWQKMKFKNQRYNIKSDPFFSMFKKQILLNNRHTVNFDKYPIKNKKFNDL